MTNEPPGAAGHAPRSLSQQSHRRLIGVLGLVLPVLLYVVAGLRPVEELPRWAPLTSVSAYYHTGAVGIFVGVLFALALFLLTYPGYEGVLLDRLVGALGGAAALGVTLFPTGAPPGLAAPSWWSPGLGIVHYVSALALFLAFILFSTWLFRKSSVPKNERPPAKRRRDTACLGCGLVMIGCVLWTAAAGTRGEPILVPESIAIVAFAISWLVKGEAYAPVMSLFRRLRG